jgi:D-inositol-3-phosphate glycosyltransferase
VLLHAFARLQQARQASRLVLAGGGSPAPYQALARELGIAARVTFLGKVDEQTRDALYAACDVFVLPSRLEGLGLVTLEAMGFGKPVVVTKTGLACDGTLNSSHGAVVPVEDPQALATALAGLLQDKAHAATIGAANRRWIAENLSWDETAMATARVYTLTAAAHEARGPGALRPRTGWNR